MLNEPLYALLAMRTAIATARSATERYVDYEYDDFQGRMKALENEAYELFKLFDHQYSTPGPE